MVKMGHSRDRQALELSDKAIETAETLDGVLDHLDGTGDILACSDSDAIAVIRFMKKYNMERELDRVGLQLRVAIAQGRRLWSVWLLATVADYYDIAGEAIGNGNMEFQEKIGPFTGSPDIYGQQVLGGHAFDITAWSIEQYEMVPQRALWALGRASRKAGAFLDDDCVGTYWEMGQEYARLMKLPCKCRWAALAVAYDTHY